MTANTPAPVKDGRPSAPGPSFAAGAASTPIVRPLTVLAVLATVLVLAAAAAQWVAALARPDVVAPYVGRDVELYLEATRRWLTGGSYFAPEQLAGPYDIAHGVILYPPAAILLFAPFLVLPLALWWLVPSVVTAAMVVAFRPRAIVWPVLALLVWWPPTTVKFVTGNPVIWLVGAVALGLRFSWPSVLVLLKPTLFPFAAIGIRQRSWWLALGGLAVLSLPFAALWVDYARVVLNARAGLAYSVQEVPMLLLPIAAWLGRSRGDVGVRGRATVVRTDAAGADVAEGTA